MKLDGLLFMIHLIECLLDICGGPEDDFGVLIMIGYVRYAVALSVISNGVFNSGCYGVVDHPVEYGIWGFNSNRIIMRPFEATITISLSYPIFSISIFFS
jgi:hypothetical protein